MFNQMTITADDKRTKKGDGINAVLKFMIEVRDFQDKLESCISAQSIAENRAKLEKYPSVVDKLYQSLADIASSGVREMRKDANLEEEATAVNKSIPNPVMMNAPQIPSL